MSACTVCSSGACAVDPRRRQLLFAARAAGAAAGLITAVSFVASMLPSERARAAAGRGGYLEARARCDGYCRMARQTGVDRASHAKMLVTLKKVEAKRADPHSKRPQQPDYAANAHRSIKPEFFVAIGLCTHFGCSSTEKFQQGAAQGMDPDGDGGFFCPCHGSQFDLAGRVLKNMPAPTNLEIPPHRYLGDARLLIGDDGKA